MPEHGSPDDRLVVLRALAKVPPRQRTALVLRYWEDLSVEETAQVMRCAAGTVKSQTVRGLTALRELLAGHDYESRVLKEVR